MEGLEKEDDDDHVQLGKLPWRLTDWTADGADDYIHAVDDCI